MKANRWLAVYLIVSLVSMQVMPAAFSESVNSLLPELDNTAKQQVAVDDVKAEKPAEDRKDLPSGGVEPQGPLSVPTQADEKIDLIISRDSKETAAAKQAVMKSLTERFGFSQEKISEWMAKGLMKIEVDLTNWKGPNASVTFSNQLKLDRKDGEVNPFDPLQGNDIPEKVVFSLKRELSITQCYGANCPPAQPSFSVQKIEFKMNGLKYESASVYQKAYIAPGEWYVKNAWDVKDKTGKTVRRISYMAQQPGIDLTLDIAVDKPGIVARVSGQRIMIDYFDGSEGAVTSREIQTAQDKAGSVRILSITDKDAKGQVIAKSAYNYMVAIPMILCVSGKPCPPPNPVYTLNDITRTDAKGGLISKIAFNWVDLPTVHADSAKPIEPGIIEVPGFVRLRFAKITLADGTTQTLGYTNHADLLNQALKIENERRESPEVKAAKEAVFQGLISMFGFTRDVLDGFVKSGALKVEVDLKALTAKVQFQLYHILSVQPPSTVPNLLDPAGNVRIPAEISFKLTRSLIKEPLPGTPEDTNTSGLVIVREPMPPIWNRFEVQSASFKDGRAFEISFLGNAVSKVNILDPTGARKVVTYSQMVKLPEPVIGAPVIYPLRPVLVAAIAYYNAKGVLEMKRSVDIERLSDGKNHITKITDVNAKGVVTSVTKFHYDVPGACIPEKVCNLDPVLTGITRTDSRGKVLSKITVSGSLATILPANGSKPVKVYFSSWEHLIQLAQRVEAPPIRIFPAA